ncbi:MAG: LysR substrate-binding domain-containing protein [Bryobacteraceae bacterium]|nr:LysR substrate-binding domain-containing protein [Bryobacteraceae bacterium]
MNHAIELRLLRYAIAVGEELHFARAAGRLNVAAPSLSKQIKQLEVVLGYELFERKTREVVLTPAGAAFVTEARQALVYAERAVECGAAASRGDTGVLSVGYTTAWIESSRLTSIRESFSEKRPDAILTFHSACTASQIDLLLKGSLQAGFVVLPADSDGLRMHRIWREPLALALPEDHRLSVQDEIEIGELVDEPMLWQARAVNPRLHDHLLASCRKLGLVPNVVHSVKTPTEAIDWVAARTGIAFVRGSTGERIQHKGVTFRPLASPGLTIETGVAYRGDNRSETLKMLVQSLGEQSFVGDT